MRGMSTGVALQWLVLAAFVVLAGACAYVLARKRPSLTGVAVALLVVALHHVAYYVVFLVFPNRLSALETMLWSIVVRLHVAGTALLALWMAWRDDDYD